MIFSNSGLSPFRRNQLFNFLEQRVASGFGLDLPHKVDVSLVKKFR